MSIRAFAVAAAFILVAGCGSGSGGGIDAAPPCGPDGITCSVAGDCCSENCDMATNTCVRVPGMCGAAGEACARGTDCCSFACVGNECTAGACTADNAACTSNGECCSGTCGSGGTCTPLNPDCLTSGNPCTMHGECCSSLCGTGGVCDGAASFCTVAGDICTTDLECCGGMCNKLSGAPLGTCIRVPAGASGGCASAGEVCGGVWDGTALPTCGGECCSRACFPYGPAGVLVCQPPSGCHPSGEICLSDGDCCGSATLPDGDVSMVTCEKEGDNPIGRCTNGNSCTPAGGICRLQTIECNANANCCAGNVLQYDTCRQDSLGIPRCLIAEGDCTDPSIYEGMECSTSADCCGLPCVPNPAEFPPFICGTECVPTFGACTTTADCCAGIPCEIPPGATEGTCGEMGPCAEVGQPCTMDSDCCNMLPCSPDGFCGMIGAPAP